MGNGCIHRLSPSLCRHPAAYHRTAAGRLQDSPQQSNDGNGNRLSRHLHFFLVGRTAYPGGNSLQQCHRETDSPDRCRHRTGWRRCQDHFLQGWTGPADEWNLRRGTGAFIDQMATLLGTDTIGLNNMARQHSTIYPVAARCGVLPKLISRYCSTKVRSRKISPHPYSRQLSTRPSVAWPVGNQSAATLLSWVDLSISCPNCGRDSEIL